MQIKKSGFVYRVAYGLNECPPSESVNLCQLVRKFIFMLLLGRPLIIIVTAAAFFVSFFFAMRPSVLKSDIQDGSGFAAYTHWPKTKSGKRIWPIWFVVGGIALWLILRITHITTPTSIVMNPFFSVAIVGVICLLFAIVLSIRIFCFKSETGRLFKAYCKAQKEKICPIIKVVE